MVPAPAHQQQDAKDDEPGDGQHVPPAGIGSDPRHDRACELAQIAGCADAPRDKGEHHHRGDDEDGRIRVFLEVGVDVGHGCDPHLTSRRGRAAPPGTRGRRMLDLRNLVVIGSPVTRRRFYTRRRGATIFFGAGASVQGRASSGRSAALRRSSMEQARSGTAFFCFPARSFAHKLMLARPSLVASRQSREGNERTV